MNEIETDRDIERFAQTASGDFSFRAYGVRYTWDYSDHCYDRLTFGGFWKARLISRECRYFGTPPNFALGRSSG